VADCCHGNRPVRGSMQTATRTRFHQCPRNENRHRVGVRRLNSVQPASLLALRGPIDALHRYPAARCSVAACRRLSVVPLLHQGEGSALSEPDLRHRLRRAVLGGQHSASASGADGVQRVLGEGAAPVATTAEAVPRHDDALSVAALRHQ